MIKPKFFFLKKKSLFPKKHTKKRYHCNKTVCIKNTAKNKFNDHNSKCYTHLNIVFLYPITSKLQKTHTQKKKNLMIIYGPNTPIWSKYEL